MIAARHLSWKAPDGGFALSDLQLEIPDNTYAVLMGQTGCGKTSLLEMLCGLRRPTAGRIFIDHADVTDWEPRLRRIGYLPQDLALFPGQSVGQQILFSLRLSRDPEATSYARELAEELGILPLLDRDCAHLSGGERQRVALARALAAKPRVLLLDEPLSALDEATRRQAADLLRQIQQRHGISILHVTHSSAEARELGSLHYRLEAGKLIQQQP